MRWLIGFGLRDRRTVVGFSLLILLLGIWQFPKMKTDVLPEFTPTTVEVQTEALGLSASEVEQLITVPLEQDLLNGVAWMESIRSRSVPGLSSIEMIFEPGTPILRARQVVQERLTGAAALPNVSKPPQMLQPVSSTSRVMMVGISSDTLTPIQLGVLARWTLRPNLLGVDGVSNVAIFGQRERQLQVQVDPVRLAAHGVRLDQIIETTGNALWVSPLTYIEASTPGAGGFIETPNQRLTVQHESPIVNAEQLAAVAVEGAGTTGLTLGDVANVVEDHQPLIGDAVFADQPGMLLVIEKYPGQSTVEVAENVEEALELLTPGLTEVTLDTEIYQPSLYIERSIDALRVALAIGAIAGALLLFALFMQWRSAVIAGISVAISGAVAVMVLYARQATINSMVLAGLVLALVLVVDDAISVTASVTRRLQGVAHNNDESSTPTVLIREGVFDQRHPALYALAITIVAAVPLLLVDGLAGESFFPVIATSYMLAIVASSAVAIILVPAVSILIFGRSAAVPAEPWAARIVGRTYARVAARRLGQPVLAIAGCVLLLGVGGVGLSQLDTDTVPGFKETDLLVQVEAAPGTSLDEMERIGTTINAELMTVEGVRQVGTHFGRAVTSDQVVNVSSGEIWVRVDDDADYQRSINGITRVINSYPGVRAELMTYTDQRLTDVIEPGLAPIDIRIFGEDREVLISKADEVRAAIASIEGVDDARVVIAPNEPSIRIKVDLDAAQQVGVLPGDVRRAAATLLQGLEVGNLFEDQRVFEVVVLGTPELRQSITTVEDLMISAPDGGLVRLGDVASVAVAPTPTVIERDASARVIDIVASVNGRNADSVSAAVDRAIADIEFPLAVHAELIGDYEAHRDAVNRVWVTVIVAAVMILLILQAAVSSWTLASLMFLTVLASAAGGVIVALIDGGDLTIGHIVGLVGAIGLGVRNVLAIVLTSQRRELDQPDIEPAAIVLEVAAERAGSIVMSTIVGIAALIPIALLHNSAGGEIVSPMAFVLVGGLVSSMVVGLWIIPTLYLRFEPDVRANQLFVELQSDPAPTGGIHA